METNDKLTLLLVDDRPENLLGLKGILEGPDLEIITAESGNKALSLMMETDVSLVLLDVQMPGMDGFETVEIMRKNSRTKHIPIIFVTAINKAREYVFRGYELGAIDYICKPIDPDVLINKVNSLIAHEMLQRSLKRTVDELTEEVRKRKETEAALREYEVIVSTSSDLLSLITREYVYRVVNDAYLETHGKKRAEIIGFSVGDLLGREVFEATVKPRLDQCLSGEIVHYQAWFDFPLKGRCFMDVWYYPVLDQDQSISGVVVNSRDITHTKELERQSLEVKKMKTVGTLAGGVAHKFNNALGAIKGNLELLRMDFPGNETIRSFVERIMNASEEMAALTSKLIAYAEQGKYQPKPIRVCPFVEETLSLIKHKVAPGVAMEIVTAETVDDIHGDTTQLQMALTAVIMNAAEAVDGRGTVTISLTNAVVSEPDTDPGERWVCLKVEDNGRGMDAETLERIFEPFFTTGFQGRGLSMAAVYGIIRNHSGRIHVESEPGKGTTIYMYLPSLGKEDGMKNHDADKGKTARVNTVLLIEDEDIVLEVNAAMLERLGYHVITAETGEQAVDIAETYDDIIDLAMLDIGLPDMSGKVLYPVLREKRPEMKVIVCSGYSADSGAKEIVDAGADGFIQKPFSFVALANLLAEHIERRRHDRVAFDNEDRPGPDDTDISIIDISNGGLAFETDNSVADDDGLVRVAVIMGEQGLDMNGIEYDIVSERVVSSGGKRVKRKSISFGEMTREQREALTRIIKEHTGRKPV